LTTFTNVMSAVQKDYK